MNGSPYSAGRQQPQDACSSQPNGHIYLNAENHLHVPNNGQYASSLPGSGMSTSEYPCYLSPLDSAINNTTDSQISSSMYPQSAALPAGPNYLDQSMFDIPRDEGEHQMMSSADESQMRNASPGNSVTYPSIGTIPTLHNLPDPPESATTRLRMHLTHPRVTPSPGHSARHMPTSARPNHDSAAMFLSPMVPATLGHHGAAIRANMDAFDKVLAAHTAPGTPVSLTSRTIQHDKPINNAIRGPCDADGIPLLPSHHSQHAIDSTSSEYHNNPIRRDLFVCSTLAPPSTDSPSIAVSPAAVASPAAAASLSTMSANHGLLPSSSHGLPPTTNSSLPPSAPQGVLSPVHEQPNSQRSLTDSCHPATSTATVSGARATADQERAIGTTNDVQGAQPDRLNNLTDTFPFPVPENLSVTAISEARKERENVILAVYTNVENWETNVKSELRERRNVYDKTKAVLDVQLKAYVALYNSYWTDEMKLSEMLQMTVARHFAQCQVEDDALRHYKLTPTFQPGATTNDSYEPSFLPALRERLFNNTNPMGAVSGITANEAGTASAREELHAKNRALDGAATENSVPTNTTLTSLAGNGSSSGFLSESLNDMRACGSNVAETSHRKAMQDVLDSADPAMAGRQLRSRTTVVPVVSLAENLDSSGMLRASDAQFPHVDNASDFNTQHGTKGRTNMQEDQNMMYSSSAYQPIRHHENRLGAAARVAQDPYPISSQAQPIRQPGRRGRPPLAEKRNAANVHHRSSNGSIQNAQPPRTACVEIRKFKVVQQLSQAEIIALRTKLPIQLPCKAFANNNNILYTFEIGWEAHEQPHKSASAGTHPLLYIRLVNIKSALCTREQIEEAGKKWFKSPKDVFEHAVGVLKNTNAPVIIDSAADKIYTRVDGVPYTIKALRSLKGSNTSFVFQNPQDNGTDNEDYYTTHIKPNVREATILGML
jgi:hypothetical protein